MNNKDKILSVASINSWSFAPHSPKLISQLELPKQYNTSIKKCNSLNCHSCFEHNMS